MDVNFRTSRMEFRAYRSALDQFLNSPNGDVGKNLAKRGRLIVIAAKRQVGVLTAELRDSIHMIHQRVGGEQQLWIGSDNDIALIHHEGSRPHAISARGPGVMRFSSRGRMVYAREVMHPGTAPNRYLSDNLPLAHL